MQLQRFKLISTTGSTGCRWSSFAETAFCVKNPAWQGQLGVQLLGEGQGWKWSSYQFLPQTWLGAKISFRYPSASPFTYLSVSHRPSRNLVTSNCVWTVTPFILIKPIYFQNYSYHFCLTCWPFLVTGLPLKWFLILSHSPLLLVLCMFADARSDYFVFILTRRTVIFLVIPLFSWILSISMSFIPLYLFYRLQVSSPSLTALMCS